MKGSKPRSGDFKMDGINSTAEHLFQVIPKLGKCQVLLHKHHLWCTGVPAAAQMQRPMLERQLCCILSLGTAVSCLGKDKQQTNKGKNQQWVLKKKKKSSRRATRGCNVMLFSYHTSHHQQSGAKDKEKESHLWWLGLSTKQESQATAKFVGEQEKPEELFFASQRG